MIAPDFIDSSMIGFHVQGHADIGKHVSMARRRFAKAHERLSLQIHDLLLEFRILFDTPDQVEPIASEGVACSSMNSVALRAFLAHDDWITEVSVMAFASTPDVDFIRMFLRVLDMYHFGFHSLILSAMVWKYWIRFRRMGAHLTMRPLLQRILLRNRV